MSAAFLNYGAIITGIKVQFILIILRIIIAAIQNPVKNKVQIFSIPID